MDNIRKRRLALGIPQGTLAALACVNRGALCQAELEQARLSSEVEQRVDRVLAALEQLAADYPIRLDFRYVPEVRVLLERRGIFAQAGV
jgi:predicted transcriptional regulator